MARATSKRPPTLSAPPRGPPSFLGEPSQVGCCRLAHSRSDLGQARDRCATARELPHARAAPAVADHPSRPAPHTRMTESGSPDQSPILRFGSAVGSAGLALDAPAV